MTMATKDAVAPAKLWLGAAAPPPRKRNDVSFADVFVLIIMTVILLMYLYNNTAEVELVRSSVDGRLYLVRSLPNKKEAANILAHLNEDLDRLVKHVMAKYGKKRKGVVFLYNNFDPDNLSEGGVEHGYTSYSVNKGEKIVMCVRQKNSDNEFVDPNVLKYVAIHELAHLMTHDVGHPQSFWDNFAFLLREAMAIGIYERVDYARHPKEYCGIKITSSVV